MKRLYPAHREEIQTRWEHALEGSGFDALLVHAGSVLVSFQDDYEYAFRANPNFLAWLPLTHYHDSVLFIRPGERPVLFYYQPDDYWYLPPADPESWWADHFDIRLVSDDTGWRKGLFGLIDGFSLSLSDIAVLGDAPGLGFVFEPEQINPHNVVTRLQLARTRKTAYEIACMRQASALAAAAHVAAEAAFRTGKCEFDIHLAYLDACAHTDSELPYGSIVALNQHAAVLHYQQRDRGPPEVIHSFLIDAGASVHGYAADVTRSYASEAGEFSDLVDAMDGMQQALAETVRPGLDYRDLHLRTHLDIARILTDFGIISCSAESAVECGLSQVFFPHGLGHFIGLQTHDVAGLMDNQGEPLAKPAGHDFLRLTRILEPDNVLTIEPGLYFIESLLNSWRREQDATMINWDAIKRLQPYGGVRIEDDVLVTESGAENLTRAAFGNLPESA
jgi:Xaa-Pro dipeptidase